MKTSINVLVIDSNESLTKDMEKYFSSHEVINLVACKNDGEEGLSYILNNHHNIDVIIMDLIIPNMDGLFILGELERRKINKNIIITSSFRDDNVLEEASSYGIDYYMMKPINFMSLEKRILTIGMRNNKGNVFSHEGEVTALLHNLGIPSHIRGYQYIKEGIAIVYKSNTNIAFITKDIYPAIAKKFDTTPTRVERAIRHAIEISWSRGDINLMEEIFGNSLNVNRDKPTNAEYLSTIADRIKVNQKLMYN